MESLSELVEMAESDIGGAADLAVLDAVRVRYLGKKGELTSLLKGLGSLPEEDRQGYLDSEIQVRRQLHQLPRKRMLVAAS